jgi:hypothetical protein
MASFDLKDTSPDMLAKQFEITFAMTAEERLKQGFDMIDFCYELVKNGIIEKNPDITECDLKIELFKRYYGHEFSTEEQLKIFDFFRNNSLQVD